MTKTINNLCLASSVLVAFSGISASAATVNFDDLTAYNNFTEANAITSQYAASGVLFGAGFYAFTSAGFGAGSLMTVSSPNFADLVNPTEIITFVDPAGGSDLFATDSVSFVASGVSNIGESNQLYDGLSVEALDASDNQIGSTETVLPTNGATGRAAYTFSFSGGEINSLAITLIANDQNAAAAPIDNLTFDTPTDVATPEPGTLGLLGIASVSLVLFRRRFGRL